MSPFADGVQFAWDATSLDRALECPRKYKYTIIDGWRPKRNSVHLLFGGWYATALEHYHKYRAEGNDLNTALRRVVHETLVASAGWESDHNAKTRENLIRTIVWYVDHFIDDPAKVVRLHDGSPAVEYSFTFEIAPDVFWCGHIDRLVEYQGDIYVQDQKTTGYTLTPRYFEQFKPHTQMTGYSLAGQAIYTSPTKGVMIDAAQIAVGFSRFERGFTFRSSGELSEWIEETLVHIGRIQEMTRRKQFPANPAACGNYGGCIFRGVCSRAPEVREQFLKADFTREAPWNPLEKR